MDVLIPKWDQGMKSSVGKEVKKSLCIFSLGFRVGKTSTGFNGRLLPIVKFICFNLPEVDGGEFGL